MSLLSHLFFTQPKILELLENQWAEPHVCICEWVTAWPIFSAIYGKTPSHTCHSLCYLWPHFGQQQHPFVHNYISWWNLGSSRSHLPVRRKWWCCKRDLSRRASPGEWSPRHLGFCFTWWSWSWHNWSRSGWTRPEDMAPKDTQRISAGKHPVHKIKGGKKPQMAAPRGMVEHLSGVLHCRLTLIDLHHLLTWKISEGSLSQWLITTASPRSEVGGSTSVMPGHSVVVVSHAAIVPVLK